jgi:hypothetical protein
VKDWDQKQYHLAAISALAAALVYICTTFATVKLVEDRHADAIKHSDDNFQKNREPIEALVKAVERIDQRTWEMNGRKGPAPLGQ